MPMRAVALTLLVASLLATVGCRQKPGVSASTRDAAETACFDRFSQLARLGIDNITPRDDGDPDDNVAVSNPNFRMTPEGLFAVSFPPITNLQHPYRVRCTGDINQRLLTSVQIDDTLHRPAPNQRWGF
jgi:hypothetical protein